MVLKGWYLEGKQAIDKNLIDDGIIILQNQFE